MKTKELLAVLLGLFLTVHGARGASKFAGNYYALLYPAVSDTAPGDPSAGVNITVNADGTLTGRGANVALESSTSILFTGKVRNSGKVTIHESSLGAMLDLQGRMSANGKKFSLLLSDGSMWRGRKVPAAFAAAGAYYVSKNNGDRAVFFVQRTGEVYGLFYRGGGDDASAKVVEGQATAAGLHAANADGLTLDGVFGAGANGKSAVNGTYADGAGGSGSFTGQEY